MSTTDTRAAFEALLEEYKTVLNSAYCQCNYNEELVVKSEAAIASLAATEAAKATGTAGELPPLPALPKGIRQGYSDTFTYTIDQMREYRQQCAAFWRGVGHAEGFKAAEAARQPAPVVDIEQLIGIIRSFGYTTYSQSREIAEALAARSQP